MIKKIAVSLFVAALLFGGSFTSAQAQTQGQALTFSQLIELFISLGIISPDKANAARSAVAPSGATSTQPSISSIVPNSSGTENALITVYGSNLSNVSRFEFYRPNGQREASVPAISVSSQSASFKLSPTFLGNVSSGTYSVNAVSSNSKGEYNSNRLYFTLTTVKPADSVSITVADASTDKAGTWGVFGPGALATGEKNDWAWDVTLSLSSPKTISYIEITHAGTDKKWSTKDSGAYPLVMYKNNFQVNVNGNGLTGYGLSSGIYVDYTQSFILYGQIDGVDKYGTDIVVGFTDGTSVSGKIPASSIRPVFNTINSNTQHTVSGVMGIGRTNPNEVVAGGSARVSGKLYDSGKGSDKYQVVFISGRGSNYYERRVDADLSFQDTLSIVIPSDIPTGLANIYIIKDSVGTGSVSSTNLQINVVPSSVTVSNRCPEIQNQINAGKMTLEQANATKGASRDLGACQFVAKPVTSISNTSSATVLSLDIVSPSRNQNIYTKGSNASISWKYPDNLRGKTVGLLVYIQDQAGKTWNLSSADKVSVPIGSGATGEIGWSKFISTSPATGTYNLTVRLFEGPVFDSSVTMTRQYVQTIPVNVIGEVVTSTSFMDSVAVTPLPEVSIQATYSNNGVCASLQAAIDAGSLSVEDAKSQSSASRTTQSCSFTAKSVPPVAKTVTVMCSTTGTTDVNVGDSVVWSMGSAAGNSITFDWSGEGLSGKGFSAKTTYNTPGTKTARFVVYYNGNVTNSTPSECQAKVNVKSVKVSVGNSNVASAFISFDDVLKLLGILNH